MDIPRALRTTKQWNRGRRGALGKLLRNKMIVDDVHRVRLVVEVLYEQSWLEHKLMVSNPFSDGRVTYGSKDVVDLKNLLEVVLEMPAGELLDGRD
jgi:hypothetical protein